MHVSVCVSQNIVNTVSCRHIFTKLTPMMCYGTEMNALNVGVKRSEFKVIVK